MKSIFLVITAFVFALQANAQKTKISTVKKDSFEVNGVCGMCKTNIEKAAKKAGVSSAEWSEETHTIVVEFNEKKTNLKKIQEQIAKAGYDNIGATSTTAAYDKLHGCCKYDRKKMEEKVLTNQN